MTATYRRDATDNVSCRDGIRTLVHILAAGNDESIRAECVDAMTDERAGLAIDQDVIDPYVACLIEFDLVALAEGREHTPRPHQQGGVTEERK